MLILLSDGSGLTARQTATQLADGGHAVHVLSPGPICLTRFTRRVRRVRRVPASAPGPLRWLAAALRVSEGSGRMCCCPPRSRWPCWPWPGDLLGAAGVRTVVPSFAALAQVQDKISAVGTLAAAGLAQPESAVLRTPQRRRGGTRFPVFLKLPIGTATTGVHRVSTRPRWRRPCRPRRTVSAPAACWPSCPRPGRWSWCRVCSPPASWSPATPRCGCARGGRRVEPQAQRRPARRPRRPGPAGPSLGWHGALSADAILTDDGPRYIDINPRLVEPANALAAGVDLVGPLLELAAGAPRPQPAGRAGVLTHQLLLAILGGGAAHRPPRAGRRRTAGRRPAGGRLPGQHRGADPAGRGPAGRLPGRDGRGGHPGPAAGLAAFVGGSAGAYSLTPAAWRQIRQAAANGPGAVAPGPPSGLVSRCR